MPVLRVCPASVCAGLCLPARPRPDYDPGVKNTNYPLVLLLLGLGSQAGIPLAGAQPANDPAPVPRTAATAPVGVFVEEYPASRITVTKWDPLLYTLRTDLIVTGTSRLAVRGLLGVPRREIAPDTVVYDNCRPDQSVAQNCDELVITFAGNRVAGLRFVNQAGLAAVAANRSREIAARPRDAN
jgi:hypothetical protein